MNRCERGYERRGEYVWEGAYEGVVEGANRRLIPHLWPLAYDSASHSLSPVDA